jgi:CHAD domain-containing protein
MLAQLSRLQDVLGEWNDIRVAEQHLAAALAHRRGRAVSGLRATLVAWREARSAVLRHKLRAAWRDYRHAKKFW